MWKNLVFLIKNDIIRPDGEILMKKLEPIEITPVSNLKDSLTKTTSFYPDNIAYLERDKTGEFIRKTYTEFEDDINSIGTGLFFGDLDLQGKKVAIIGKNSYNWIVTYYAVMNGNSVAVPIDANLTEKEIENVLKAANVDAVVHADELTKTVNNVITKNQLDILTIPMTSNEEISVSFESVKNNGKNLIQNGENRYKEIEIDEEMISLLICTSGTSSDSKVVELSQRNIASNLNYTNSKLGLEPTDLNLNILPFHHVYATTMASLLMMSGGTMALSTPLSFKKDMAEVKPTVVNFVPAMFSLYRKGISKAIEGHPKREMIERLMYATDLTEEEKKIKDAALEPLRAAFGGNLKLMICAAAPMDPEDAKFFTALGISNIEAYGLSEAGPVVTLGDRRFSVPGTVGFPFPSSEMKIKIIDKNEYDVGEIAVYSPGIMRGYLANKAATAEALFKHEDGNTWLHTGDLGTIKTYEDPNGEYEPMEMLSIVGRKKNVIVLPGGKNVYPEEIEALIGKNDLIAELMVKETEDNKRLMVMIFINPQLIKDLDISIEEAQKIINASIEEVNLDLPDYKKIKTVEFRDVEFPKTTTRKIQRGKVI